MKWIFLYLVVSSESGFCRSMCFLFAHSKYVVKWISWCIHTYCKWKETNDFFVKQTRSFCSQRMLRIQARNSISHVINTWNRTKMKIDCVITWLCAVALCTLIANFKIKAVHCKPKWQTVKLTNSWENATSSYKLLGVSNENLQKQGLYLHQLIS